MSDYWKADTHQFCARCGGRVVAGKRWVSHYESETGEPVYRHYLQCVKWRWWALQHFHEEFEGDNMIVSYEYY